MQNKRNVHNSGPLGMLIRNGQVQKVDSPENQESVTSMAASERDRAGGSYFRTQTGIEFTENELTFVDPKECEPWEYANRSHDEMGEMEELMESIRDNKQLQPALVRMHPSPHDGIKYEIIFGRRRHQACLNLNIPFMVIKRDITNLQDAIAKQDAENKSRKGVSYYSNALLYKKLLLKKVFNSEKELAAKLHMPVSSLNDLMVFAKLPDELVKAIPNIHQLSISMALKIVNLINSSKKNHALLLLVAKQIGISITSPTKLERIILDKGLKTTNPNQSVINKLFTSNKGKKLFTFKTNHRGIPTIVINKELGESLNYPALCEQLKNYLENV